jgi:hypothetical protein
MGQAGSFDYIVEPEDGHWTVNFGGQHCGCFASRRQALRSAASDAERVRNLGHRVRVLVRYAGGRRLRLLPEQLRRRR